MRYFYTKIIIYTKFSLKNYAVEYVCRRIRQENFWTKKKHFMLYESQYFWQFSDCSKIVHFEIVEKEI